MWNYKIAMLLLRMSQCQDGVKVEKRCEWRSQGIESRFRKPKLTKEPVLCRKIKKIINLSQNWSSKLFSVWSWKPTIVSLICHPRYTTLTRFVVFREKERWKNWKKNFRKLKLWKANRRGQNWWVLVIIFFFPLRTYKFSIVISILFLKELVERIR